jgi:hypothetical protein
LFYDFVIGWDDEAVIEYLGFAIALYGEGVLASWALFFVSGEFAVDGGSAPIIEGECAFAFSAFDGEEWVAFLGVDHWLIIPWVDAGRMPTLHVRRLCRIVWISCEP